MIDHRPNVSVGVLVVRDGKVLLGKRLKFPGEHTWCTPGGYLEFGESWEDCARRETREEAGLEIRHPRFFAVVNDPHPEWSVHTTTVFILAEALGEEPRVCEPEKCEQWGWFRWEDLPRPLYPTVDQIVRQNYHPLAVRHDKLVRDRIIEIIEARGGVATHYTADMAEYTTRLRAKLGEEVIQYLESGSPEELADILEVIHALTALDGTPREQLQLLQTAKRADRGGFEKRIVLTQTIH